MTKLDNMTSVELDAWKRSGTDAEIKRMREAAEPFLKYLEDIRFNLRMQPRLGDAAIEERGERIARVTWAEFYKFKAAFRDGESSP